MTTVLITGPTRGLGRATAVALARHRGVRDLLLLGRGGPELTDVAEQVRSLGVAAHEIACDLSRLADVRTAAATVRELVDAGRVVR